MSEIQEALNGAIKMGLLEAYCACGKKLTQETMMYKNSEKGEKYVKKLMKEKGLAEKQARKLTIKEFMNKLES